jgi:hypothetical protein
VVPDDPVTLQLRVQAIAAKLSLGQLAEKLLMMGAVGLVGVALGRVTLGGSIVIQAVFWSLPASLLAARVQHPLWVGEITDEPVKGTCRLWPAQVRWASPSPLIDQQI